MIDDVLKNFIYNQRKNIFNIINQSQFAKDYLGWIQKTNEVLQYIPRFTYTISNLAFLTSNISRDAMDAAIKVPEKDTTISGLKVLYRYMKNVSGAIKLICMQLSAKNREEFDTITTLFGGAEQTQYREGDYTTSYLDYKLNKKGKIVRGGILGWLETLADVLGNTDLMMRIESVDQRAKQLGLDIHEANASYDDYVSLNLPKKYLKKYITDEQIEAILGKDKANAWKETKDNEYFPYVPEEFEKEQLNNIFSDYEEEITNKFNSEIMSELQDVFDRCSIDFSKGTITSRSLGKIFLFANTRIQGGAQLLSFVNSHKKAATGSFLSLMMLGILKTLLGWSDDNPSDENKAVTGISIKNSFIRAFFPVQTAVMIPVNIGESIGRLLKSDDKSKNRSLINDLSNILWDNTLGAFTSMSGIVAVAANTPTFLISGELPNYGDEKKYNEFNYFKKKKAGINVDTLAKKTDSLLSKKLSNWLVNNGIYRFSSHEIDRFINMFLGNAEKQVEGVLGLGSIFNDKTNKIDWLNWKFDPVRDLLDGMLKPFSIKELTRSKDSDYINELAEYEMSKYDRFTGQVNTSAANRVTPDRLAEEDRAKFQKYFDRSYLAKRAINGLKIISDFASQIDKNKEGGEKAYRELVTIYKDMARFYRDFLENYDSDDNSKRSYQKYYKFIDNEIVKQNDKLTKIVEENALAKERPNLTFGWLEKDAGATETTEQDKTNAYYRSHPMTSLMESNTIDRDVSQIYDKRYGSNHLLGAALKNFINKIINNDNYKNLIKTDTFIKDSFKDTNVGASSFDSSWKILSTNKWFENEYMKFVNDEYSLENNKNKDKVPKELHSNDAVKELVFSALNHAGKNSSILSGIDKPSNNSKEYIRQLIDKLDTYGSTKGAKNRHLEELYVYGKYAKYLKDNNKNYDYEELEKIVNDYSTERKADSTNPIKEKVNGKYVWKSKDNIEKLIWGE